MYMHDVCVYPKCPCEVPRQLCGGDSLPFTFTWISEMELALLSLPGKHLYQLSHHFLADSIILNHGNKGVTTTPLFPPQRPACRFSIIPSLSLLVQSFILSLPTGGQSQLQGSKTHMLPRSQCETMCVCVWLSYCGRSVNISYNHENANDHVIRRCALTGCRVFWWDRGLLGVRVVGWHWLMPIYTNVGQSMVRISF